MRRGKLLVSLLLISASFAACKKTYQCQCSNSNGTYDSGEVEGTKRQAKKHCQSLSAGATTCDLK